MSDTEKHHPFSPSALAQFELCPGAYRMQLGLPEKPSEASIEGTAMHKACECEKVVEGFNEEQKEMIEKALEYRNSLDDGTGKLYKEVKISILDKDFSVLTEGTSDFVYEYSDRIIAGDYKFGRILVEVDNNIQLLTYACGLLQKYHKPIEFHIIQPRRNYYKAISVAVEDESQILERIKRIISMCKQNALVLNPSEKACRFCKAKNNCPACKNLIQSAPLAKVEHCSELSTEQISQYLVQWRIIKKIGASLENQARERLIKGEEIPNWKIRTSAGAAKVTDPQKVFETVQKFVPVDKFMSCVKVKITDLVDLYAKERKEQEAVNGNKVTLKQCREELLEAIMPFCERESDRKSLVYTGD